jgi:hypothetical protein
MILENDGDEMKIVLELTDNLGIKMDFEEGMTYPIAFGLLKHAIEDVALKYRLGVLDERRAIEAAKKSSMEAPNQKPAPKKSAIRKKASK